MVPLFFSIGRTTYRTNREAFKEYSKWSSGSHVSGNGTCSSLISLGKSFNADLVSYLFGSLVAVSRKDLIIITIMGFFIIVSMLLLHRELFSITFDEEGAQLSGIPVRALNIYFTIMTALVVALSVRVVGALLISALMVIPAAVSLQVARSFKSTFIIAIGVALFSVITGLYTSFLFDLAPGGTIVLIASAILMAVLVIKGARSRWI